MATAAERQALLFLSLLAIVGGGVRAVGVQRVRQEFARANGGATDSSLSMADRALAHQRWAVDSARAAPRASRKAAASSTGKTRTSSSRRQQPRLSPEVSSPEVVPVDLNGASAAELERLPRVGPALAGRIIAWREQHGPFSSIDDLRHVRGIGPSTARLLEPLVTFSGRHSPIQREASVSPRHIAPSE